jgi:hypothetical protein
MVKKNEMLIGIVIVAALLLATGTINFGGAGAVVAPPGGSAAAGCPTIVSATLVNKTYDADKPSTGVTNTPTVYLNAAAGTPYPGGLATQQLASYDVLMTASNYFGTLKHTTTSCSATPDVVGYLKGVDTPTVTVYNTNGITANAVGSAPLAIGSSGSGTAHLKFSQTTAYKHLTGESGKFCVLMNATNVSDWNPGQSSAVFNGVPCVAYTSGGLANSATPSVMAGSAYVMGFVCTGDFAPNDGAIYDLAVKIQAASGVDPAAQNISIVYGGADYSGTAFDALSGKVGTACVTESGAAIQTLRDARVVIS